MKKILTLFFIILTAGLITCSSDDNKTNPQLEYTGATLEAGTVGQQYNTTVATATGASGITYTLVTTSTPPPPAELQVTSAGAVNWINPVMGTHTFQVTANAKGSEPQTATFTVTIRLLEMVRINAGSFTMGSPEAEGGGASERPQHQVTLTQGFYMGKYQVTQDQYYAVMGTNPSHFHGGDGREPAEGEIQGRRPVENVTWYHAIIFCNKLSVMEGLTPAYEIQTEADTNVWSTNPDTWGTIPERGVPNARWESVRVVAGSTGYRLPTEAQWEYACRAGTTTAYNTGAEISDDTGWYTANSSTTGESADRRTRQVGLKPANAWGLHDMHGNVWEWVWDWFGNYTDEAKTDPVGASSGSGRVIRGGAGAIRRSICVQLSGAVTIRASGTTISASAWSALSFNGSSASACSGTCLPEATGGSEGRT